MLVTQLVSLHYIFSSIIAASLDFAGIGSLLAAGTACIALFLGYRTNKRSATNAETVSYVDNNLKTMQATLDWVTEDNKRLREVNEVQRLQNLKFVEEINHLEHEVSRLSTIEEELERCKQTCARLTVRLNEMGSDNV